MPILDDLKAGSFSEGILIIKNYPFDMSSSLEVVIINDLEALASAAQSDFDNLTDEEHTYAAPPFASLVWNETEQQLIVPPYAEYPTERGVEEFSTYATLKGGDTYGEITTAYVFGNTQDAIDSLPSIFEDCIHSLTLKEALRVCAQLSDDGQALLASIISEIPSLQKVLLGQN